MALLIFGLPFIIYYLVIFYQDWEEYDNYLIGDCVYVGTSDIRSCSVQSKGKPDGEQTDYLYYDKSDECEYQLSYTTKCATSVLSPEGINGKCYITKCEEDNSTIIWESPQDVQFKIIICFASLFLDILLLTFHLFGCWYYSKVLKRRKQEDNPNDNVEIDTRAWHRDDEF